MVDLLRRAIAIVAFPFLALLGLLFLCLRVFWTLIARRFGWELVWPPVLVDDLRSKADSHTPAKSNFNRQKRRGRSSCRSPK
jgi:hypothetical protein